jgi:phenylpyruvate tautomerase PptA (4-oxalocrotonate tautomerase family)
MPLVRIDYFDHRSAEFGRRAGELVYETMVETINVPKNDKFFVASPKTREQLGYDEGYLGVSRSDGIVFVQITLSTGRTVEQKKALYRGIADRFNRDLGVRREDVFITLIEVTRENWSFGNGEAQYT